MRAKIDQDGNRIVDATRVFRGSEPRWNIRIVDEKQLEREIGHAINWYSVENNNADFRKWVVRHLQSKGKNTNFPSDVLDGAFRPAALLLRLKENGCPFTEKWEKRFHEELKKVENLAVPVVNVKTEVKTFYQKVQETKEEKIANVISVIDELVDRIATGKLFIPSNITWEMLKISVPNAYIKYVQSHLSEMIDELEKVQDARNAKVKTEEQEYYIESYSHFSNKNLIIFTNCLIHLENLCDTSLEKLKQQKQIERKPREKKMKSPDKVVENCLYQHSMDDPKINSIHPRKILGADQVILFNTEKRVVTVLKAIDSNGLFVKSTTIIGFDEKNSYSKLIKKPKLFLEQFLKQTSKPGAKNFVKEYTGIDKNPSGRMNSNTLILKVD